MQEDASMNGACHRGTVRFAMNRTEGFERPRRCVCSLCRVRGAVVVTARHGDLRIISGVDQLRLYRFNTMKAEHYFCAICGMYTHRRQRSNPDQLSVNVACLEGVSPFDFARAPFMTASSIIATGPAVPPIRWRAI